MSYVPSSPTGLTSKSAGSDTAVVICNGPSLTSVSNEWLDRFPTFGSNRVWLKYSPDVLVTLDLKMVHNAILQQEMLVGFDGSDEVYVSRVSADLLTQERLPDHAVVLKAWNNIMDEEGRLSPAFSNDPLEMLVSGGTVTYGLLQFAFWKGFRKILVVGCNHTFRDPRGDHFDDSYNAEVGIPYDRTDTDPSLAGSGPGEWFWNEDNFVAKVNMFYSVAQQAFANAGGEIINCTPDTKCPVFRVDDWRNY